MQATIHSVPPFDALLGTTIRFSWNGNQAFKNRCIIKDNETNVTVYDNTITTFQFEHSIDLSKAKLKNGKKYNVYITVFDKGETQSDVQAIGTLFHCIKTPVFRFENIIEGQNLQASSYAATLSYSQESGELLNSWSITLYSRAHSVLSTSGTRYEDDLTHTFYGFENNQEYSIRGQGETVNGIILDTGFINISVSYEVKDIFSLLVPKNLRKLGAIRLSSNIVSAEGRGDKDIVYIDNSYADLRDNTIHFTDGFEASGNFSYVEKFCGMKPNDTIAVLYGDNIRITITYRIVKTSADITKSTFELMVSNGGLNYVLYSNYIDVPSSEEMIGLCFYRINGIYNTSVLALNKAMKVRG